MSTKSPFNAWRLTCCAGVLFTIVSAAHANAQVLADSIQDFSLVQGHPDTDGSGHYHYYEAFNATGGGQLRLLVGDPATGAYRIINSGGQSAGASYRGAWASSIREWNSGVFSRVRLRGLFQRASPLGDGMDFWIRVDGRNLYTLHVPAGDTSPYRLDFRFWVGRGSRVQFVAGPYRSNAYDNATAWWIIERDSQQMVGLQLDGQNTVCAEYSPIPRTGVLRRGMTESVTVLGRPGPYVLAVSVGVGPPLQVPGIAFALGLDPRFIATAADGTIAPGTQPAGCGNGSIRLPFQIPTTLPVDVSIGLQAIATTNNGLTFSRPLLATTR